MSYYGLIFLTGVAASWHCAGMCGGFACALSGACGSREAVLRQLLYNSGRATSYCFLGAMAGAVTAGICTATPGGFPIEGTQRVLAIVSGLFIMLIGAQFFGFLGGIRRVAAVGFGGELIVKVLRDLTRSRSPAAPLALGVANGFLPCPLVYGFLAQAAASGDAVSAMATMAAFGLGTFPIMLTMGSLGQLWRARILQGVGVAGSPAVAIGSRWRLNASTAIGIFFVLLGLITLARGLLPMQSHGHLT